MVCVLHRIVRFFSGQDFLEMISEIYRMGAGKILSILLILSKIVKLNLVTDESFWTQKKATAGCIRISQIKNKKSAFICVNLRPIPVFKANFLEHGSFISQSANFTQFVFASNNFTTCCTAFRNSMPLR